MSRKTKLILSSVISIAIILGITISPIIALAVVLLSICAIFIAAIIYMFLNDFF